MLNKRHTRKKAISEVRNHLLFFGCNTYFLSDDEMEAAMIEVQRTVRNFGISVDEAYNIFKSASLNA